MYGDEVGMISPSALFRKEQAEGVFQKARETHEACQRLVRDLRSSATERVHR